MKEKSKQLSMTFIHRICGATDGLEDVVVNSIDDLKNIPYLSRDIKHAISPISEEDLKYYNGRQYYLMGGDDDMYLVKGFLKGDKELIEQLPLVPEKYRN